MMRASPLVPTDMCIDHVTAIVTDADAAAGALHRLLGVFPAAAQEFAAMRIRSFRIGDAELHLNEPTGPGPVADYQRRHGPAYHHLAFRVADLDRTLMDLSTRGLAALGPAVSTMPGLREVFLDPCTTGGLLIQLVERAEDSSPNEPDSHAVLRLVAQSA